MEKEIKFKTPEEIQVAFEEMKTIVNGNLEEYVAKFVEKGNKTAGKEARMCIMDIIRDYLKPLRESIQYVKNTMPKKNA